MRAKLFKALLVFILWACLAGLGMQSATNVYAKARTWIYTAPSWTLTLTFYSQASYGLTLTGSLNLQYLGLKTQSFHVEGDWIPAGDSGGDLLRFYGHPFNSRSWGLVSVATFYSTCDPDCATSPLFDLTSIRPWTLPTVPKVAARIKIRLIARNRG
jgi:hypothetical protein